MNDVKLAKFTAKIPYEMHIQIRKLVLDKGITLGDWAAAVFAEELEKEQGKTSGNPKGIAA